MPWRRSFSSNNKQHSCKAIHPLWSSASLSFFWMTVVSKGKTYIISSKWCCLFCSGVSLIWKRVLHACNHYIYLSPILLTPKGSTSKLCFFDLFVFMHGLWIKWFTPWWRRPCTYLHQPCFKEYHSRLKLLLKGFHLVVSLSSFHKFLYLLNRTSHSCKSLWNNSIFLSKKVYNETCLRVIISSFGCLSCIFLMVWSNFLCGCS